MKLNSRLFALAVMCLGMPAATLEAQPLANKLVGAWELTVSGPHIKPMSAVSVVSSDGGVVYLGSERFPGILGIGAGTYANVGFGYCVQKGDREFQLRIQTELPGHLIQRINGEANLSVSGLEVSGNAETQILSESGRVLYSAEVNVKGKRVSRESRLTAMR
jgi:hypothetical protein